MEGPISGTAEGSGIRVHKNIVQITFFWSALVDFSTAVMIDAYMKVRLYSLNTKAGDRSFE